MSELAFRDPLRLLDWTPRLFNWDQEAITMRVEEYEEKGHMVVKAEIPGINPDEDVKITVSHGLLRISARRHEETEKREKDSYRSEFHYGLFVRDIPLPLDVKQDDVTASYKDGVLTVKVPMPEARETVSTIPVKHE